MEHLDIYHIFQCEFNRLLTPLEKEIIEDWKKEGFSDDTIIKALKQAVYNSAVSFRYIYKILQSWKSQETNNDDVQDQDLSWLD